MKRKSWVKNNGFSLVELIIAIAILVILTGLLAPQFMRYMEKSRTAVCVKNRDEMLNIYRMEFVSDIEYSVEKVIIDHQAKDPCPSKGNYTDGTEILMGIPWIFCSEHDAELLAKDENTILSDFIYSQMEQFKGLTKKEIGDITGITHSFNSKLRDYIWKKNGEKWPQFSNAYVKDYPELKNLYIQPYFNAHVKEPQDTTGDDVIVFARKDNTAADGWSTSYIYDKEHSTWYAGPVRGANRGSISIGDKNWKQIKALMDAEGWKPLY